MFGPFKTFNNGDRYVTLLQQNTEAVLNPLVQSKIIDGQLVTVTFKAAATDTTVNHNLGRPVVAWFPGGSAPGQNSGPSVAASVFLSPTTQSKTPNSSIILQASAPCTVSIWFC